MLKNDKILKGNKMTNKDLINQLSNNIYKDQTQKSQKLIPVAGKVFDQEEIKLLLESVEDFWLTAGRFVQQFESEFSLFMQQKYCLLTNSGSSANLLAISPLTSPKLGERRLKPGDEVITVAAGFPTTVNPIVQNQMIPVFVDVDVETYNINVEEMKKALSPKTRAIMIAHTLGNPFNLKEVTKFAKDNNLYLIEDCCDAVGSTYDGKMVGTFGDIATVSFYPAHHMTMGEGGAILTNKYIYKKLIESFRDWGRDCYCEPGANNTCGKRFGYQMGSLPYGYDHKYIYSHIGYNLKITDMQAAIGVAQLKKLPDFIKRRKENFNSLFTHLKKYEKFLVLPKATENSDPSWFAFPLSVREGGPFVRNDIVQHLETNNILTRMLFAGNLTRQPAYEGVNYRVIGELKNTDFIMKNTFVVGVYPGIDNEKMAYMLSTFDKFFEKL
jgi:CDP-4-dehydro-6-deoxyglucose reductase, E1